MAEEQVPTEATPATPPVEPPQPEAPKIQLPISVVGKVDVSRLLRELRALSEFVDAAALRVPGTQPKLPRTSKLLDEIFELNKINPLIADHRTQLVNFLTELSTHGPMLHMSFSADPSVLFTSKLMTWLRQNIHPHVLLQVGLQPTIGAGCVVRTQNKYFDLSLREHFKQQREILLSKLHVEQTTAPSTQPTEQAEATT